MSKKSNSPELPDFVALLKQLDRMERKLDKLDTQSNLNKKHLNTHETCMMLGCQRSYLWKLVKDGKLTKIKLPNNRTYYAMDEIRALIESPLQDAA